MHICEYCKSMFSTKCNLYRHQRTTKACLVIQKRATNVFRCKYCNKTFYRKDSGIRHTNKCKHTVEQGKNVVSKDKIKNNHNDIKLQKLLTKLIQLVDVLNKQHNEIINKLDELVDIMENNNMNSVDNLALKFIH